MGNQMIKMKNLEKKFDVEQLHFTYLENILRLSKSVEGIFGCGERFDSVNHKGKIVHNEVLEKFCYQGDKTYFPLPFFFTEKGFGIFIKTLNTIEFDFSSGISIDCKLMQPEDELHILFGTPKQIITTFIQLTGEIPKIGSEYFGPWISAHCWNSEKIILQQIKKIEKYQIPATVIVIEQWSDEATFACFNQCIAKLGVNKKSFNDFAFEQSSLWQHPVQMISAIHKAGMKILLWQCPVVKNAEECEDNNLQNGLDWVHAINNDLVLKYRDGSPYTIPEGHWFSGSLVPDFSNRNTREWWFSQRQYLLDMGVDGFKTDGGEFIYHEDVVDSCGHSGNQLKNHYSAEYTKAYSDFVGKEGIIFSRAGYLGQQSRPAQWAGDQQSNFNELRSVLKAGLSAVSSGLNYWGFDIGGFAGPLPSVDLYKKSVQLATFVPIMQFHSEPSGGQFKDIQSTTMVNNERSPWNIAEVYNDETVLILCQKYFQLRMSIIPHIVSENKKCLLGQTTLMRHCFVEFPEDYRLLHVHDQFMFGNLLIAPYLYEKQKWRKITLPEGEWMNLFTLEHILGPTTIRISSDDIPVYVPVGSAIISKSALHQIDSTGKECDSDLYLNLFGCEGKFEFYFDNSKQLVVWNEGKITSCTLIFDYKTCFHI